MFPGAEGSRKAQKESGGKQQKFPLRAVGFNSVKQGWPPEGESEVLLWGGVEPKLGSVTHTGHTGH